MSEVAGPADLERTLDVVVKRTEDAEPDSIFVLARGIAMVGFIAGYTTMCSRAPTEHPVFGTLAFVVAIVAGWLTTKAPPRRTLLKTRSLKVRVTSEAIAYEETTIPLAKIATAQFRAGDAHDKPSIVCLNDVGQVIFQAHVENEAAAGDILRAIQRDPTRRLTKLLTASPFGISPNRRLATLFAGYPLLFAAFYLLPQVRGGLFAAMFFGLFLLPRLLISLPGRIDVGADGLVLRWLGMKHFVGYDDIERVELSGHLIRIVMKKGFTRVVYPIADAAGLDELLARIESSRRARMLPGPRAELEARLGRGERSVDAWRRDLASIEDHDGYREAALPRDELWRIVEDPAAPEDARVGAALVLRRVDDAPRLRVAAEAVASPKLRVALESAADPNVDEELLEERISSVRATASR